MLYQAEPRPDERASLPYFLGTPKGQALDVGHGLVRGHIRLERRDGNVSVTHRLVVGAIMWLPVVLPFLDPVVGALPRVDPFVDHGHVIPPGLHRDPEPLVRPRRRVDVEEGELRHAAIEHESRDDGRRVCRGRELKCVADPLGRQRDARYAEQCSFERTRHGSGIGHVIAKVRLLRILQERTYQPLGGTRSIEADVRIVAATNKDLAAMVKKGAFRQDLYYRINVVTLDLPPLRERMEDIPMLVNTFIDRLSRRRGLSATGFSSKALSLLMAHSYPGNIRELENIVEHALVLCPKGQIDVRCLPEYLRGLTPHPAQTARIDEALKATEARIISGALKRNHYNRLAAARELGVHKSTLFRKIKRLNIHLPETDGRSGRKPSK